MQEMGIIGFYPGPNLSKRDLKARTYPHFLRGVPITHVQSDFIVRAVREAIKAHGTPEIINSDQGSQFTSKDYTDCINSYKTIKISMDGKGRATDNARTERFFRSFKWERLYLECPETVLELKQMTKKYIDRYNWKRGHQSLDDQTPASIYYAQSHMQEKAN
jgi:putative transposase